MNYFVHPQGICESHSIGDGTRVWAFAHVLPGARIGKDCNICDHVFVENDVVLGDRVTVKCGVQLWDGVRLADDVFVGPNATFTNDKTPRSKHYQAQVLTTHVGVGASIGANATILPGVTIGSKAMIGAGCVVTNDVPANAIVVGNPGRIAGYVNVRRPTASSPSPAHEVEVSPQRLSSGVLLQKLKAVTDLRGTLSVGEFDDQVPFMPERYFVVFDVPSKHVRGEHAHRVCKQFLICVRGSIACVADNGTERDEIVLNRPDMGLYVPPMVWCTQYKYSSDAVLLVFASHRYDAADYIRDYDQFLAAAAEQTAATELLRQDRAA